VDRLLIAIVHRLDADAVGDALRAGGHRFTYIPTVGGFLGAENATFLVGCAAASVEAILEVVRSASSEREVQVPLVLLGRLRDWQGSVVAHRAATVFVVELERSVQL
jgi:uncharacterized protein YaaQ